MITILEILAELAWDLIPSVVQWAGRSAAEAVGSASQRNRKVRIAGPHRVLPFHAEEDGPGNYLVSGRFRNTPINIRIRAVTMADAKQKAESKQIDVVSIRKMPR